MSRLKTKQRILGNYILVLIGTEILLKNPLPLKAYGMHCKYFMS